MSKVLVEEYNLEEIARAIRNKNGSSDLYYPSEMPDAIEAISGSATLISKTITENGTYSATDDSADGYGSVTVEVENSYEAADEGKVVSSGVLVAQTSRTVMENGTYDTTENNELVVNVSGGGGGSETEPTLPAEYQEVEYIDFDNKSWVTISGRTISGGFGIISVIEIKQDANSSMRSAFGCDVSGSSGYLFRTYITTSNGLTVQVFCNQDGANFAYVAMDSTSFGTTVASTSVKSSEAQVGSKHAISFGFTNFDRAGVHLMIGNHSTSSSTVFDQRIYKVKQTRPTIDYGSAAGATFNGLTNETVTWYKPCYRKADNVAGWYDTAAGVFYTNEGTGSFAVGPDVA